jgi:hypothetical protein
MPFSQATITSVNPPVYAGFQVFLSWTSTSPAGTWFQIYLNESLSWWAQTTHATMILGTTGPIRVDIGTVDSGEAQTDFSSSLPSAPARRAELSWLGGTFEDPDIAGFRVYGSDTAGGYGFGGFGHGRFGEVDVTVVLADITAYPSAILTDGFGFGGFGYGGFGQAAGTYTWVSDPLAIGNWSYAVVPYDSAGNAGTIAQVGVTINCPPLEPALFSDNTRLHYTYSASTHEVTLNWLASPG